MKSNVKVILCTCTADYRYEPSELHIKHISPQRRVTINTEINDGIKFIHRYAVIYFNYNCFLFLPLLHIFFLWNELCKQSVKATVSILLITPPVIMKLVTPANDNKYGLELSSPLNQTVTKYASRSVGLTWFIST